jgi:hypothetical protein
MNCCAHSPIVNTARSTSYPIGPEIKQIIAQLFPNDIKVAAQRRAAKGAQELHRKQPKQTKPHDHEVLPQSRLGQAHTLQRDSAQYYEGRGFVGNTIWSSLLRTASRVVARNLCQLRLAGREVLENLLHLDLLWRGDQHEQSISWEKGPDQPSRPDPARHRKQRALMALTGG